MRNNLLQSKIDAPAPEAQKAYILKQGEEGLPVAETSRKAGISQAIYFNWKKKYAGLPPDEMRWLKLHEALSGPWPKAA